MIDPALLRDEPNPPPRSRRGRRGYVMAGFLFIVVALVFFEQRRRGTEEERDRAEKAAWMKKQKGLPPSGGRHFAQRLVIPVPVFAQSDAQWGSDSLGPSTTDTLSSAGCAVSSCAMILASYGVDTDPQRLNDFLKLNNGFTSEAWLKWEIAAQLSPGRVKFIYEDDPSFQLIDENLERGNPVIIRLRYPSGITHFVVICGKDGLDYLITDPGHRHDDSPYPLKEFGSNIEALRYYEPVPSATPPSR